MSFSTPSGSDPRGAPSLAPGASPADSGDLVSIAISEQIVALYLEAFGRGPTKARTYVQPQFAVCILRDTLTTGEHSLIASDGGAEVEASRAKVIESIDRQYVSIVETQTGRPVLSHLARTRVPVDVAVHFFLFDDAAPPRDGADR
jgi:uncharacterized protein YbcI